MAQIKNSPGKPNASGSALSMFDHDYHSSSQLQKEDIVILVLSLILIVATMWLASTVL